MSVSEVTLLSLGFYKGMVMGREKRDVHDLGGGGGCLGVQWVELGMLQVPASIKQYPEDLLHHI